MAREEKEGMIYRSLGTTGERVSAIGIGGYHLGLVEDEAESIQIVRHAIESGITFMDNSWDYNEGKSEIRMGKALQDGYRDRVFLMTKLDGRNKKLAKKQLDESLKRLQTDHVDLLQIHEVIRWEDPERVFAEGGALEAFLEAKQEGKTRFIGFTGHKDPKIHKHMLDTAAKHGFRFDTVQMPLNLLDGNLENSFQNIVVPILVEQQIGVLGMKPISAGKLMEAKVVSGIECLHYSLSLPTNVVITGCDSLDILNQALEAAKTFKQLDETERAKLLERTKQVSADGRLEAYKTTHEHDSTAMHPEWLGAA